MKRSYIIGILAAGLMLGTALENAGYSKAVLYARNFQQHFHAMDKGGGSLGPVERFMYSLILAKRGSDQTAKHTVRPEPRT
jgi:hypothetical protein